LKLPDSCDVDLYSPPTERLSEIGDDHWLKTGVLPAPLRDYLASSDPMLVVVNDHFRPTPTAAVLQPLANHLDQESTFVLVATALHPSPTEAELRLIFGDLYQNFKNRIGIHNAFAEEELREFAAAGRKVKLNRLLADYDRILTIGSVEPHYFAGFTGGRKIFLPGCASFEDTRLNHALAVSAHSRPLVTRGNPVWEDIQTRTVCLDDKKQLSIQLVTGHHRSVLRAEVGGWDDAYLRACRLVAAHFGHAVEDRYDVVISVVYPPLDRNLYQLQKSYENVAAGVRDGGTILLLSSCSDGVGDDRFLKLAAAWARGEKLEPSDPQTAAMGIHKVTRTAALAERVELRLLSQLPEAALRWLPIKAEHEINRSISELLAKYGRDCRIAVVLDSASQVLYRQGAANAGSALTKEEKDYA
jgi:nickel-dependent lactate racemase